MNCQVEAKLKETLIGSQRASTSSPTLLALDERPSDPAQSNPMTVKATGDPQGSLLDGTEVSKPALHPPQVAELSLEEARDAREHLEPGAAFDEPAAIRDCLQLYHDVAAGVAGVLVLTVIDTSGTVRPQQFAIGDVDGMAAEALARGQAANVYFAPATLRRDLSHNSRGTANDIVAVLGLVIDDDCDTGKRAILPPGIGPTIEVTTSTQPAANRHYHFVFTRPLSPQDAKALAALLHRKCGGDHGTKDIAHVWRLPQTLNHPNAAKLARGRPAEPQSVEVTGGTFEPVDPDELRRILEAMPDADPRVRRANGAGAADAGHAADCNEVTLAQLPLWLQRLVMQERGSKGDRSSHCHHVMQALMEYGLSDSAVRRVAEGGPFARKYTERGDLDVEIERERARWQENRAQRVEVLSSEVGADPSFASDVKRWPSLESNAAYGLVGEIARLATRESEADPVAVMATTLAFAGASFGRNRFYRVGDTLHHARFYVGLVGDSSRARKGTSLGPVERAFREAETILHGRSTLPSPAGLPLNVSHGLSTGEGLTAEIRDKRNEEDTEWVQDKRLQVIEGEFGAVLRHFQRQGNTLSTALRSAWDGRDLGAMTKHNRDKATAPHVCIVGHITGHELGALLTKTDIWNGVANRFLWLAVRRSKVVPFAQAMPDAEVTAIAKELARVIEFAHSRRLADAELTMSNSARDHWADCYPELTHDHPGILGAVTSRAEAQVLRLAMAYAQLDGAERIELCHLEAALSFWQYAFDSAAYIFGGAELDPVEQKILEAVASGSKTQTEIVDLFGRNLTKDRIDPVLNDLQVRGRLMLTMKETAGRPRKVWSLP